MAGETPELARKGIAAAVNQALWVVVEPVLRLRSGRRIGDLPSPSKADNLVYDARLALRRLLGLWAITIDDYNATLKLWAPLTKGTDQVEGELLKPLMTAIRKALQPILANDVANDYLPVNLPKGGSVGLGGTHGKTELAAVQNALRALGGRQKLYVEKSASPFVGMTAEQVRNDDWAATLGAIRELKRGIASGTLGWWAIRSDEDMEGADRFGGRTYSPFPGTYGELSVFVPRDAKPGSCFVHVFFSPGDATGNTGNNAVLMHGVRGAFFKSKWIVIGVPGYSDGAGATQSEMELNNKKFVNSISTSQIQSILNEIWGTDTNSIDGLSLSAHSRGVNALMYTLGGSPVPGGSGTGKPTIDASKVAQVTVFDDRSAELGPTMAAANLKSKARVLLATEEVNTSGLTAIDLRSPKLVARDSMLAKECWRAIGYVRFLDDMMRMGRFTPPADRMALINLLTKGAPGWQDRGQFSVSGLQDFCAVHADQGDVQKIIDPTKGLRDYVYDLGLVRTGQKYLESVDRHHFHVAEVINQAVLP